jgi:hypothetical protein
MKNGPSYNVNTLRDDPQVSTSKRLARPPLWAEVSLLVYCRSFLGATVTAAACSTVEVTACGVRAPQALNSLYAVHATTLHRVRTVNTLSFHSSYFLIVPFRVTVSPSSKDRVPVSHLNRWPSPVNVFAKVMP